MELKELPKLILVGCGSQGNINSTIFVTFIFLVSVLLHYNLDLSMLKCEGSLKLKETHNSYFCVTHKNNRLMFVSWKY